MRALYLSSWLALLLSVCPGAPVMEGQARDAGRSREPLDEVEELSLAGRHAEARAALEKARQVYRSRQDRQGEALCSLLAGLRELRAAKLSAASAEVAEGGATLASLGDPFGTWVAEWLLGSLKAGSGQFETSVAHFERSLASLREVERHRAPFAGRTLKYVHRSLGLPEGLLAQPELGSLLEAMSRDGYVWALVLSGRFAEAETELSRLADFSRRRGGRFDPVVEVHRGELRRAQGRLEAARESFRKALEGASALPPAPFREEWPELQILEQLTAIELLSGRCTAALEWSAKTLEALRLRGADRALQSVLVRVNRAKVLASCGDVANAEAVLAEAVAVARQGHSLYLQATTESQLGRLLAESARRFEPAARHLETAVALFQSVDAPLDEATAWMLLAECYVNLEAYGSAGAALDRARTLARQKRIPEVEALAERLAALHRTRRELASGGTTGKDLQRLLGVLQELRGSRVQEGLDFPSLGPFLAGYLRFHRGKLAEARDLWAAAGKESPTRELEAYLQAAIGVSYWTEGKIELALPYFNRAADCFELALDDVRVEELLTSLLGGRRQGFFQALVDMLVLRNHPQDAFEFAERSRARAFLLGLGNPRIEPRGGADATLVAEAEKLRRQLLDLERQRVSASAAEREQVSPDLHQARERFQSLLLRLKVTHPSYSSRKRVEPLRLRAVQTELPPGTTLVSYYVSGFQVHAWVVDKEAFHYVALPLRPQDLPGALCWADGIGHRAGDRGVRRISSGCGGEAARSEDLYAKLIAPLAAHIRHRKLVLVLHGALHYLPFAALRNPATGRYLMEDSTLTYVPSATVLGFLRGQETPAAERALVLGAPTVLDPSLKHLPAAAREAEAVARLFGARLLLGAEATEGRLHGLSGKVDLVHIAAHGIYEPRDPQFSRIALAPDKDHDGNLEVHEILSDLDLSGVNLVVLSACETARGERSGGDEVTGLTRAFLHAGSLAVISTLWNIHDVASATLMEDFYRRLLAGAPTAEACGRPSSGSCTTRVTAILTSGQPST